MFEPMSTPIQEMIAALKAAGYSGISLDTLQATYVSDRLPLQAFLAVITTLMAVRVVRDKDAGLKAITLVWKN